MKIFKLLKKVIDISLIYPFYNFNTLIDKNLYDGSIYFSSSGKNILSNTNQIKSNIINDLSYRSIDYISNLGISIKS